VQDAVGGCLALWSIYPFSVDQDFGVRGDAHRSALIQRLASPAADVDRGLKREVLSQGGSSGGAGGCSPPVIFPATSWQRQRAR
jgi:hypothetical protein